MDMANKPIDGALDVIGEFRKSQLYGPEFATPVVRLFNNLGFFDPGVNIDSALDRAISNVDETEDAFKLIPVMWANIPPPVPDGTPEPCSHGAAQLPISMDVLLNGRRVMLCNN
jgi:phospholipid/cholesterol/gamma-HCH transport system substrate-binding protein